MISRQSDDMANTFTRRSRKNGFRMSSNYFFHYIPILTYYSSFKKEMQQVIVERDLCNVSREKVGGE